MQRNCVALRPDPVPEAVHGEFRPPIREYVIGLKRGYIVTGASEG